MEVKVGDSVKTFVGDSTYKVTAVLKNCVFAHTPEGYEFPHAQRLEFNDFEVVN